MLNGKMGNFGAKRAKNHGFDWQQRYGGGALVKAPKEKWGKMGKPNQSTPAPHVLLFAPTSPHNTPFPPISSHCPLIPPPFPPISPHFPQFFLVLGTLRVRCWVYYHAPRPGISEACHLVTIPPRGFGAVVRVLVTRQQGFTSFLDCCGA